MHPNDISPTLYTSRYCPCSSPHPFTRDTFPSNPLNKPFPTRSEYPWHPSEFASELWKTPHKFQIMTSRFRETETRIQQNVPSFDPSADCGVQLCAQFIGDSCHEVVGILREGRHRLRIAAHVH